MGSNPRDAAAAGRSVCAGPAVVRPRVERLFYLSDNFFATNPYSSGLLLCMITLALVVLGGSLHWLATGCDGSLAGHMWAAWRFVTDGGDYHEKSWAARAVGLVLVLWVVVSERRSPAELVEDVHCADQ